ISIIVIQVETEVTPEATAETTPDAEMTPESTADPDYDSDVTIVIEGPVERININIITIYGLDIELDEDDPLLTVIQIGDVIRIEGDYGVGNNTTIIIVAINIIFINIDVYVLDGDVWRDGGN